MQINILHSLFDIGKPRNTVGLCLRPVKHPEKNDEHQHRIGQPFLLRIPVVLGNPAEAAEIIGKCLHIVCEPAAEREGFIGKKLVKGLRKLAPVKPQIHNLHMLTVHQVIILRTERPAIAGADRRLHTVHNMDSLARKHNLKFKKIVTVERKILVETREIGANAMYARYQMCMVKFCMHNVLMFV